MNKEFLIKRLGQNDTLIFKKLIQLFDEVFENEISAPANETHLTTLLSKSEFIAFIAIANNEVAGGLTAYELPMYYLENSEVYIYDIAVKSDFQRKGLGKKMLLALNDYCKQNGIKQMFVEAHDEDNHAIDFYHSASGHAEKVVHFNFSTATTGFLM
ncbi:MAG: GNAT family N-acetyltransferase [Chitinophagaceae bacterium]